MRISCRREIESSSSQKHILLWNSSFSSQRLQEKVSEGNLHPREQLVAMEAQVSSPLLLLLRLVFVAADWAHSLLPCLIWPLHLLPHRGQTSPGASLSVGPTLWDSPSAPTRCRVSGSRLGSPYLRRKTICQEDERCECVEEEAEGESSCGRTADQFSSRLLSLAGRPTQFCRRAALCFQLLLFHTLPRNIWSSAVKRLSLVHWDN